MRTEEPRSQPADPCDKAAELAEEFNEAALERRRAERQREEAEASLEPRDCAECGDEIPMQRIRAVPHAKYCACCQEYLDARAERQRTR